jgi:hypothetical protein
MQEKINQHYQHIVKNVRLRKTHCIIKIITTKLKRINIKTLKNQKEKFILKNLVSEGVKMVLIRNGLIIIKIN